MQNPLIGHEKQFQICTQLAKSSRLPHSILIHGEKGIGKAKFAEKLALYVLSGGSESGENYMRALKLALQGAHPDLKILASVDEKDIPVDEVRAVSQFLSLKPTLSPFRVVIVDSVDDLNRNSSNAILKTLEEPPPSGLVILISHRPGMLLDTIKSRCFKVALDELDYNSFAKIAELDGMKWDEAKAKHLHKLSAGSIGLAKELKEQGGLEFADSIISAHLSDKPAKAILDIAAKYSSEKCETSWSTIKFIISKLYSDIFTFSSGLPVENQPLAQKMLSRKTIDRCARSYDETMQLLDQAESINLDKKQVLLLALNKLAAI